MPKITINKKDVLKLVGSNIPDEKLKDRISMLGTDLEYVSKDEICVEIFPNRPDLLTAEGFSRALSSFAKIKTGLRSYKVNKSGYTFKVDAKTKKVRPAVAAAVVKGIKTDDIIIKSIMDMQDKLTLTHGRNRKKVAIGIHDLSSIKFPLTYTTKQKSFRFTPLDKSNEHTLDEILETHPKGKEFAHLLKDFKEYPVWIDSNNQVLSMPPIINSEETKLKPGTKDLFIDITGTSQLAVEQALNIIVTSLADRNGKIYSVNSFPNLNPKKIKIDIKKVNKILGLNLSSQQIKKLLEMMGMTMIGSNVIYPAYRTDILDHADIIEDIAIAYGYENFTHEIPNISTIAEEDSMHIFKEKIADICIGLGLQETLSLHLSNKEDEIVKTNASMDIIKIKNALSREYNTMRSWIVPSLLKVLKTNKHNEYPQNIFEIGKVFIKKGNNIAEPVRLGIALCHNKADYTEARKILDSIISSIGLTSMYKEAEHKTFIKGRVARVSVENKEVAYIGEIHPEVLNNFEIDNPVSIIELNLTDLFVIKSKAK
ncbi:MAG: phenylalanine--tRNA ligase subunit beta [Nanoarchaeota archaeon]|nr:phenylalanine--tRNA ligase subunit beta [Nanoarchaeota archaeon]